ncbi:hypothetical protein N0V95_004644 [Ascochyta clinopodiicola]|nr:hypothetical protein N0V95_004644 [Ascochyta clinopodiicola]
MPKKEVLDLFEGFRWKGDSMLNWPVFLAFDLERVDRLLQTSATARKMITGRMMSLLTDLSIITECLRQILLWSSSPDVRTGRVDGCGCKVTISEETGLAFDKWNSALHQDFSPPLDLIYPLRGKLYYPEHEKRNRDTVAAMCKAEANLDHFWAAVDSHFEKKTGVAQYRVIQKCLEDSGEMHRTAPWANTPVSNKNSSKTTKHEFQSIPDQLHDKTVQITGAFDKMTVVEKIKAKTRGVPESTSDGTETSTMKPSDTPTKTVTRVFTVDKRTLNVFRTLFSVPSEDIGEVAKSIKWVEFKRAMVRIGFSAEKLQGSAWQFTPATDVGTERGIHFHEPHPDSDINYVIAKRIGRRLGRVYGWCGDTFQLA